MNANEFALVFLLTIPAKLASADSINVIRGVSLKGIICILCSVVLKKKKLSNNLVSFYGLPILYSAESTSIIF